MAFVDHLVSYASEFMETQDGGELQQRLRLYQVFLKLYEHHRGLLDEILGLEHSGSHALTSVTLSYVQGVTIGQEPYLVTNLVQGCTQALTQAQRTWVIGRDPQRVTIFMPDDRLSRCHAALKYVEGQGFYLVDLNSRNGSYVNGELVRQSRLLQDGDRIRLGCITFVFFHCRSIQPTPALTEDVQNLLQTWNPSTTVPNRLVPTDADLDPTAGRAATTKPLDETSMFMRTDLDTDLATDQPLIQPWDF